MPRGFQNQLCVYCGARQSTRTGDHVFPRSFFLEYRRANLPKVPACELCNNQKSQLEHYLATILPFGGRHADAGTGLEQMVPPRLAQNRRLHHELAQSRETLDIELNPGVSATATVALAIDGERLHRFMEFAVKGLLGFHWNVILSPAHGVRVMSPTLAVAPLLGSMLGVNARQHISGDLGAGTVRYEGAQSKQYPELTVWTITILGGLLLADTDAGTNDQSNSWYAITGSNEFLNRDGVQGIFGPQ